MSARQSAAEQPGLFPEPQRVPKPRKAAVQRSRKAAPVPGTQTLPTALLAAFTGPLGPTEH